MNSATIAKLRCCCKPGQPGGCWFLAQACCPERDGRTLAYPCTEPNVFDVEVDPPPPVTFVFEGNCFTLYPTPYNAHQAGWTDITAADIGQIVPDCTDPACGEPCVRYYQPLLPCCEGGAAIGIAYGDCDPQYWFGQAGVVSFKIGSQCYIPDPETVGGLCTGFATPPPTYIGPGPYSFQTYPSCAECCAAPPPPVGCPDNCTECKTYTLIVPPVFCAISAFDYECCVDTQCCGSGDPICPCCCPVGSCAYNFPGANIQISKPGGPDSPACIWSGAASVTGTQTGCCVGPQPTSSQPFPKTYTATVECDPDAGGTGQWMLVLNGGVYQRTTPPTIEGCPKGFYIKLSPFKGPNNCNDPISPSPCVNPDACLWPDMVEIQ